jgi:NADH-quinone oxidoreductase subunit A
MFEPVLIAGFIVLFVAIGGVFLAANLLVGWLVRPRLPNAEKLEVYECGEPTIGSSFVQFDLRFYVVALLFIIFDVEVAVFFPWATVFGKAVQLSDPALVAVEADGTTLTPAAAGLLRELGVADPEVPSVGSPGEKWRGGVAVVSASPEPAEAARLAVVEAGRLLARTAAADMAAFYVVLLVGFAYVWYRGDLDWVRAFSAERAAIPKNAG